MSAKSDAFENDLLKLIFHGTPIPGLADNAAAPLTTLYLSLHTSDPGEAGGQNTNEVNYTGYQRVAVARSAAGWSINSNQVNPVAPIEFGEMTGGTSGTATYAAIGTAEVGVGKILYRGSLSPTIPFNIGVTPRLRTTTTITED